MDDQQLPLNLENYTKFIHDVFSRSLVDLSNAQANVDIGKIQSFDILNMNIFILLISKH